MSEELLAHRQPPVNMDAEKGVLGAMLRDNLVISDVLGILRTENFYHDAHQKIFEAMIELYNQAKPVDAVSLFEVLKKRKQLEDVGGAAYLTELWECAPTAANAELHANIVREKAILRNLIHTHTTLLREAYESTKDPETLLDETTKTVLSIAEHGIRSQTSTLQESVREVFKRMDAKKLRGDSDVFTEGVPSLYRDLDDKIVGFHNSELIVIAARPGVGKTAFALNLVRNAILHQYPVFFVSLEMSRIELAERLVVCEASVSGHAVRRGMIDARMSQALMEAADRLRGPTHKQNKLFIDDSSAQTMLRIAATARRLQKREGIRMVVIDYLQLVEPENRKDPRQEQVAQISRKCKFLAKDLNLPVLALAQVNRSSEDRSGSHVPRLADLRESGAIEQDADVVMILHRPALYEEGDGSERFQTVEKFEIYIQKQRNGPTGQLTLSFHKDHMRFDNYVPGDFLA